GSLPSFCYLCLFCVSWFCFVLWMICLVFFCVRFFVFFFYGSRALRDLHSFPTRRSSDLARLRRCTRRRRGVRAVGDRRSCRPWRSEEHTSELQSRFDLVCRLLLEKKKNKKKLKIDN